MKPDQPYRIEIRFNYEASKAHCAICHRRMESAVGLAFYLEGTQDVVCRSCASVIDPQTLAWRNWAETVSAALNPPDTGAQQGEHYVRLVQLGPVDQSVLCPLCQSWAIQVAGLMFSLPDGRVIYLDHRGSHVFGEGVHGQFIAGITLTFRCVNGHAFYRHYRRDGDCTKLTGIAAEASRQVMIHELQPLWSWSSTPDLLKGVKP